VSADRPFADQVFIKHWQLTFIVLPAVRDGRQI
jgi:hypothetical protein